MPAVKALFAVTMHLIEGFTNRHTAFLQLHVDQGQTIDQNRHIVAVGVAARLLKLLDYLHLVAGNVLFIQQVDVLNMAIVKHKIMNIVIMDFAGFIDDAVAGPIHQVSTNRCHSPSRNCVLFKACKATRTLASSFAGAFKSRQYS